jgi:hypothetical protein
VSGIIAVAVGDDLLIGEPGRALHGVGLAMVLGGPVLYLVGESLFRLRVTGAANVKRLAVAAILVLLAPLGSQISALALSVAVAALLSALALWELRTPANDRLAPVWARRRLRRERSCATFDISNNDRREHHEDRGRRWERAHRRQRRPPPGRARA